MRTGSRIRLRVRKSLCVSVLGLKQSIYFSNFENILVFLVLLYNKLLFRISYSDSVYLTLYGNMVQTKKKNMNTFRKRKIQKCPRSVTNSRTKDFLRFLDFGS